MDAETETLIPMNGGVFSYGIPGNWIGRQPENGGNAVEPMRDVAPCLTKADRHGVAHPLAFGWQNSAAQGDSVSDAITPTLDKSKTPAVMQPMVFDFTQITSSTNRSRVEPGLPSSTLSKHSQMNVATRMAVRRLTPRECERLQGFSDDFTAIPWRTYQEARRKGISYETLLTQRGMTLRGQSIEECPDGPRYKALGNSMAVPVMRWIGERIQMVENAIQQKAA